MGRRLPEATGRADAIAQIYPARPRPMHLNRA